MRGQHIPGPGPQSSSKESLLKGNDGLATTRGLPATSRKAGWIFAAESLRATRPAASNHAGRAEGAKRPRPPGSRATGLWVGIMLAMHR